MKFLSVLTIFFALIITPAIAQETTAPEPAAKITIEEPYAFATLPGSVNSAAFMVIKNNGDLDDKLIGVKSDVAKHTEIHENIIDPDDGRMMMRKIKKIEVPQGEQAVLEPKGKHIMFIKLKESLTLDASFELTLMFDKSGEKTIPVKIIQAGTLPSAQSEKTDLEKSLNALKDGPPITD